MFKNILILWIISFPVFSQTKLALVGEDITFDPVGYSQILATRLGSSYQIQNFGVKGSTILKKGEKPYINESRLDDVFNYQPDVITIMFGHNDSKQINWQHKADFIQDYLELIDTLSTINPMPEIILVTTSTGMEEPNGGISWTTIKQDIVPLVMEVSNQRRIFVIDVLDKSWRWTYDDNFKNRFITNIVYPTINGHQQITDWFEHFIVNRYKKFTYGAIGNSITDEDYGATFLTHLRTKLGTDYNTIDFGLSARTLMKTGDIPYWEEARFHSIFGQRPDIITIMLGTNDTKNHNWDGHFHTEFKVDLIALIDTLATLVIPGLKPRKDLDSIYRPQIILSYPPSSSPGFGRTGEKIRQDIIPVYDTVSSLKELQVLDVNTPTDDFANLTKDGIHPNAEGMDIISEIYKDAILNLPPNQPVLLPIGFRIYKSKKNVIKKLIHLHGSDINNSQNSTQIYFMVENHKKNEIYDGKGKLKNRILK